MKALAGLLLLISFLSSAQSLYNNGALISIQPNTVLSVKENLVNDGQIINNGNLLISGAWTNNNSYDAGDGEITFTSSGEQIINHHDQSVSKLTIRGGGQKIFLANITVENLLTLDAGVLLSKNDARIVFRDKAQITGGSDLSHISGPVYQEGTGDKLFPFGNGSIYLPVSLVSISGSSPFVGITPLELTMPMLHGAPGLTGISVTRYWQLDVQAGSLINSRITLPVRNENGLSITEQTASVAQSPTLQTSFENLGQSSFQGTTGNGKVTSDKAVSASLVAVAAASSEGDIIVYNAVSPNGDGLNEYLRIENIERYPQCSVSIYNRWGDKVFEVSGYDNMSNSFHGRSNVRGNKNLPTATYFYTIEKNDGSKAVNGYLSLKASD